MKRLALVFVGAAALVAGYFVVGEPTPEAADHADSPSVSTNTAGDIADVYGWTNNMANKVSLIMTFDRGATVGSDFDTATTYTFNLSSSDGAGGTASNYSVDCTFSGAGAGQTVDCSLSNGGGEIASVDGNIGDDLCSTPGGGGGCDGDLRVLAEVFDDPFFFNAGGFTNTVGTVNDVAGTLDFNDEGCPDLDADTAAALVGCLGSACDDFGGSSGAANDAFAGQNIRALVLQVRKDAIDDGGDVLAFWGSTANGSTQIDRAGRPAITTALVGPFLGDATMTGARRDAYNGSADRSGWATFAADIQISLGVLDALNAQ